MKRIIICATIIALLFSIVFITITDHYKNEILTDEEWQKYLTHENKLYHEIDEGGYAYNYNIQDVDTKEIYFTGSLTDCKLHIEEYECTYGECVIMPDKIILARTE